MFTRERKRYEMFLKVQDFIQAHISLFPPAGFAGQIYASLQASITAIADLAGQQVSAKGNFGQTSDVKGDARDRLYVLLQEISGMTKSLAYVVNGLENKFRLPYNRSNRNLIAAGRAFAADAVEYKAQFIEMGMDADFIDQLTGATGDYERALALSDTAEQTKVGSTASFAPHIKTGMIAVQRLDPIVKRMFHSDAATLAAWTFAKHVERAPQSPTPAIQPNT
ncbi:MAG TPA: hypothetical protein VGC76_07620 [Pyrinomonadaceae bacterium]|jgi:hypothetical protein